MANINQQIKTLAMAAVKAASPTDRVFGTVTSEEPLKIKLDNGIELEGSMIELTNATRDYITEIELLDKEGHTDNQSTREDIKIKRKYKIYNRLKKDEKVMLLKVENGQKFVAIDRVVVNK